MGGTPIKGFKLKDKEVQGLGFPVQFKGQFQLRNWILSRMRVNLLVVDKIIKSARKIKIQLQKLMEVRMEIDRNFKLIFYFDKSFY